MKIRTKLGLGFGGQVLLAAVLGIGVLFGMAEVDRQFSFVVEHDAPVIAHAEHLSKLVVDMETGQRGFCITQQEEFLEPYTTGAKEFDALIKEQKKLVSDNSSQVAALERIEHLVHEWKKKAAEPEMAMARKVATQVVDAQHLQEVLQRGVGKQLMDRIMALGHEIEVAFSGRGDWEGAFAVEVIEKCMADREDGQRGFLITGKEEFLAKYAAGEQKKLPEWFGRLRAIISERGRGDELSGKVDRLEQLTREWTEKAAEPEIAARREMKRHPESLKDVAALLEAGTGKDLLDEIRREFSKFIAIETRLTADRYSIASATTAWTRNLAAFLLVFAICVGVVVAVLISHAIARPVVELARGADAVGSGDLDTQIKVTSSDEVGVLARAFNAMASNLKEAAFMRRQAEEALREAKDYTDNILRSMTDILVVVAPDGRLATVNDACCALLGHQEEELLGQPASLLFSEEEEEEEEEDTAQSVLSQHALPVKRTVLRRLANEGSVSNVEKSLLTKSGDRIPVLLSGAVMRDDEDEIRGIVCLALDITDRKRAEAELLRARDELEVRVAERTAELKNSEARYQDLYDNAPDMFLSVDASSTRVVQCNKTLLTATGFREKEVVGRGMFDLLHPNCLPAMQRAFQAFVNTGKGKNVDLLLRRADGGTIDVSLNVSAVRDADGKITHSRSAMRDITEHKRAEELIRRQQEELNHAARLSTMGEMATGLAHEINQPLAAIAAYADGAGMRIRQGNAEIESLAEIFDRIAADAHRAGGVIRRLRRFVKKRTTGCVPSDINETVREVCRFMSADASQQQTALHVELADALPCVPADAVQVQQVILNLIRNALDAMRDAGTVDRRVSIETRETETHGIEVIVQDTGPGISPGLRDQVFEQFFTSKDDGLGMGLAISQSIIEAHGGRIWFASPPSGGARVHITLPPNATEPDHA